MPQETTNDMGKLRNRLKAKKFRDKQKSIQQIANSKLKDLEVENSKLK